MNQQLTAFVAHLYDDGVTYDASQTDRLQKRRNLEPATASLLAILVRLINARHVIEIGTANGYSTLWLADAVGDTGGRVVTVDTGDQQEARLNMTRAEALQPGLARRIEFRQDDGGRFLATLADTSIDLLFLDAERVEYPGWWPHPVRVLRPGAMLAIDNVLSHPDEVAPFLQLVASSQNLLGTTIAVGKGLHLVWRRRL